MIKEIIASIVLICIITWLGFIITPGDWEDYTIEIVDCYDNKGNLIIGLECEDKIMQDPKVIFLQEYGIWIVLSTLIWCPIALVCVFTIIGVFD